MKRKTKTPTAILTADWHIRGDRPVCRTDDYMEAQRKKIVFILSLANRYKCPILVAGDVGHRAIWGDKLLNWFIRKYFASVETINSSVEIIAICGQHDLPNHRLDKWEEAGLGVLSKSLENFTVMREGFCKSRLARNEIFKDTKLLSFPYSTKIDHDYINDHPDAPQKRITLIHQMVIKSQKDKLWPDQQANSAEKMLKKFPCYDLIVSGDNHQSFAVEYEGRWLVNPGSLMRMTANQIDHRPSVYLWYAEDNSIERVYLPIEKDVISREHIEVAEQRNSRIESFVNRLKETEELGLSYEKNMEEFLKTNRTRKRIIEKIWESME